MRPAADLDRLQTAALRQPGAGSRSFGIKFQCPACHGEGHDDHQDNACLFNDGTWGCAWAKDTPLGRAHWEAIGVALGMSRARQGSTAPPAQSNGEGAPSSGTATVWDAAIAVPDFLAQAEEDIAFLEPRFLIRGAITEVFAPRGLGKTHVAHAITIRLARDGLRVLLVDRDNPRHEVRRRLRRWGGADARTFKVIGRDKAPALTDAAAWQSFPLDTYDLVLIDSIDAATEGVGEGDSAKPAVALASVLDLARRKDGPAILVLGNVVKSGAHSRGCGVLEDRADLVYEVRDASDLKPTGSKDWWHELPLGGVGDWASRASRRRRRDTYRLAFVPTKFRLGEEPDPFIFEVDHTTNPWTLREVTADVVRDGQLALNHAAAERAKILERASLALQAEVQRLAQGDEPAINKSGAEALLQVHGLTRKDARTVIAEGTGRLWELRPAGKNVLVTVPGGNKK